VVEIGDGLLADPGLDVAWCSTPVLLSWSPVPAETPKVSTAEAEQVEP